jgi:ParB family chromosome partitioning protein
MPATALEEVAVEELRLHPENPRRGDVDAIARSIQSNGFYGALVAQTSSHNVLVGNHRLQAARRLGMASVPVLWADVDDDQARRILLVDNRTNDLATYDEVALVELLLGLEDLDGTGFGEDDLAALIPDAPASFPSVDENLETDYRCPKCGYEWSGAPQQ